MANKNYQQLTRTFLRLSRFSHLSAIASWDMFAMMPPGGSTARGDALAELSVLEHQILTSPDVSRWIAEAAQEDLNDVEQANLREMTRLHTQAAILPASLVEDKFHWTDGGFGYFPSYTLGAMYAAQLFSAASRALPDLNQQMGCGDFSALFEWLRQNIWQHGSRFTTEKLITQATGEALSSRYFRAHLESRYL